jgi:hypothetical protein
LLASETAEKPRVKPSPESNERVAPQPAQSSDATVPHAPAFDALASDAFAPGASSPDALRPELLSDEAHRAAAERSAPWQVRHANRIRFAALVGLTAAVAGLSLYGWNSLRPTELDKLQITLPARTSSGLVEPAASAAALPPQPAAVAPSAIAPKVVQPAPTPPKTATAVVPVRVQPKPAPQPRLEAAAPAQPSANPSRVTHLRRGDAPAAATAAAVAAPTVSRPQAQAKPDCAESVAALGLCK